MMYTFNTECDSSSRCSTASPAGDTLGYYPSPAGSYSSMGSPQSQDFTDLSAASASFIPTVTAISTSPDLQWMVQPQISSTAPSVRVHPYSSSPCPAYPTTPMKSAASKAHSTRRGRVEQISNEEDEKKRVRRERNKQAAAKCRNRRRELTDTLQAETDDLEDEKSNLQNDIANLMKEKERLEFILAAHRPICKIPSELDADTFPIISNAPVSIKTSPQHPECSTREATTTTSDLSAFAFASTSNSLFSSSLALSTATVSTSTVKMCDLDTAALEESLELLTKTAMQTARSVPEVDLSNTTQDWEPLCDFEPLCTPVVTCTPSCTTYTSSFVFTYPEADAFPTCGVAHRRGSSSNDQSSDCLSSPTLLTL